MDITKTREQFPVYTYTMDENLVECLIPFSSEIKFNLFVRDMNRSNRQPSSKQDGLCVFMKGAPERILSRCSKIMVQGREVDFDANLRKEVNAANDHFGSLGERVLAFAKMELDPAIFTKSPPY